MINLSILGKLIFCIGLSFNVISLVILLVQSGSSWIYYGNVLGVVFLGYFLKDSKIVNISLFQTDDKALKIINSKFGGGSTYFDGAGDSLSIPDLQGFYVFYFEMLDGMSVEGYTGAFRDLKTAEAWRQKQPNKDSLRVCRISHR